MLVTTLGAGDKTNKASSLSSIGLSAAARSKIRVKIQETRLDKELTGPKK